MLNNNRFACTLIAIVVSVFVCCIILSMYLMQLSSKRPVDRQNYAIVMDAGSTGTRSTLFRLELRSHEELPSSNAIDSDGKQLNNFIQIFPISRCKNGKALTDMISSAEAKDLIEICLKKFIHDIRTEHKGLNGTRDFAKINPPPTTIEQDYTNSSGSFSQFDFDRREVRNNSSSNASKHEHLLLYLGATAGMRTLASFEPDNVRLKFKWVYDSAVNISKRRIDDYVELGIDSFRIMTGPQEAAYSWLTVNYFCNKFSDYTKQEDSLKKPKVKTLASLELGGSSAQIAYEKSDTTRFISAYDYELNMFNKSIAKSLYARSDPCLGIVQASSRAQILSIRNYANNLSMITHLDETNLTRVDIELDCWYSGWQREISVTELKHLNALPCMRSSQIGKTDPILSFLKIRPQLKTINLIGKLNQIKCNSLIENLLNTQACRQNFDLCLEEPPSFGPPLGTPFVALSVLSNFAHALKLDEFNGTNLTKNYENYTNDIDLNFLSIDHPQTLTRLNQLCQTPFEMVANSFNIKTKYLATACFDYNYMLQLMTKFYGFEPSSGKWSLLKFRNKFLGRGHSPKATITSPCQQALELDWSVGLILTQISELLNTEGGQLFFQDSMGNNELVETSFNVIYYIVVIGLGALLWLSAYLVKWFVFKSRSRTSSTIGEEFSIDYPAG